MPLFQRTRSGCIGLAGLLALTIVASAPLQAQQPTVPPPATPVIPPGSQLLMSRVQAGAVLDGYLESLRGDFFQIDADVDGRITQRDVDLHALMERIQQRTFSLNFVMSFDLDGDAVVTEDEVRRTINYNMRMQLGLAAFNSAVKPLFPTTDNVATEIETAVASIMALDVDKDGKVTVSEAGKFGRPGMPRAQYGQSARALQALTLDPGSKSELTLADYQAAGEALFRKIDSNNDGKISQKELVDYHRQPEMPGGPASDDAVGAAQKRLREQADMTSKNKEAAESAGKKHEAERRAGCDMPAPSPKAKIILLSAHAMEALSSVTIGSQDVVVHAGRIIVEPGDEPLYVIVSTYAATIWQFSGAVDRVERLMMSSSMTGPNSFDQNRPSLVGATGLSQEKITFFSKSNCLGYFSEMPSSQSIQTVSAVREATGQEPSKVSTAYSVLGFSIPSGKVEALADAQGRRLIIEKNSGSLRVEGDSRNFILRAGPSRARDDLYVYSPGGLIEIDPKSVVASLPAQTYEVFPQQAGLVQLLASGALTQNRAGEYVVPRKMRFPPGLAGAHSVKFVVLRGVPVPDGDPGHSCVTVEDQTSARKFEPCR
jgi:Ca2+-binding EF-hand superfamily protein